MQPGFDGADRDVQRAGYLNLRAIVPITQYDGGTIHRIELLQEELHPFTLFMVNEFVLRIGSIGIWQVDGIAVLTLVRGDECELAAAETIDTVVGRNGEQPGGERPPMIVSMQVLEGPQEGLLGGIFRRLSLAQHSVTEIVYVGLIGFHKLREGLFATLLRLRDQCSFVLHIFSDDRLRDTTQRRAQGCAQVDWQKRIEPPAITHPDPVPYGFYCRTFVRNQLLRRMHAAPKMKIPW